MLKNYLSRPDNIIKIKDVNYSPIQLINQLKGYYYINPVLTISLGLTLFSFAGIPPLLGFFAKQMVLTAAISTNLFFMVILSIITSVISAVYYLIIIKTMCFNSNKNINNIIYSEYNISSFYSAIIALLSLMLIYAFFFQDWINFFNLILNY